MSNWRKAFVSKKFDTLRRYRYDAGVPSNTSGFVLKPALGGIPHFFLSFLFSEGG